LLRTLDCRAEKPNRRRDMRSIFLLAVTASLACSGATTDTATACAQVVEAYLGLPNPVAVTGQPRVTSEGRVDITYESTDGMNLPVEGEAACTFSVGDAGEFELMEANVNGEFLSSDELAGIRSSLGERD
jgi:hypothetical protein